MLRRFRQWRRYRYALSRLTDEHLGSGWRISPEAYGRLEEQARRIAGCQPGS